MIKNTYICVNCCSLHSLYNKYSKCNAIQCQEKTEEKINPTMKLNFSPFIESLTVTIIQTFIYYLLHTA